MVVHSIYQKKRDSKLIPCDDNWKLRGFQHPVTITSYDCTSH